MTPAERRAALIAHHTDWQRYQWLNQRANDQYAQLPTASPAHCEHCYEPSPTRTCHKCQETP